MTYWSVFLSFPENSFWHLMQIMGWLDVAKVLGILHHRGIQLILASSWARPAKLVKGKGRGGMFLFLLFLHFHFVPLSSLSFSFISSTISFISFLPFSVRRHEMTYKGWHVKPQHNQSVMQIVSKNNLLEMSTLVFWKNKTNVISLSSAELA